MKDSKLKLKDLHASQAELFLHTVSFICSRIKKGEGQRVKNKIKIKNVHTKTKKSPLKDFFFENGRRCSKWQALR